MLYLGIAWVLGGALGLDAAGLGREAGPAEATGCSTISAMGQCLPEPGMQRLLQRPAGNASAMTGCWQLKGARSAMQAIYKLQAGSWLTGMAPCPSSSTACPCPCPHQLRPCQSLQW